ncbi:MAG: patatin-like phospholipase family protein [Trueperaceae bacterium]
MPKSPRSPSIALVLSGGAARGFAHIGVLQALEARDLQVDAVAGTSMGAVIGALYASGLDAAAIFDLADELTWRDLIDLSLQSGVLKGDKLRAVLAEHLPDRFEDLRIPLAVTTTDLELGEERTLLRGPVVDAVRASSSFPGAFEPVRLDGRTMADGGIVNNLPVAAAALLGGDYVIASDATAPRRTETVPRRHDHGWWERMVKTMRLERRSPMIDMLLRGSDVMQAILTDVQYAMHPADLRIVLDRPEFRLESFREVRRIVSAGRDAAERAFDRLERERPDRMPPSPR